LFHVAVPDNIDAVLEDLMRVPMIFLGVVLSCATALAKTVELTVRKPDGTPAAGAKVAIVESGHSLSVHNLDVDVSDCRQTTTSAGGVATFEAPTSPSIIVVVDPSGFAQVDSLPATLQLQSWGRVEGDLKIGSAPGAKREIGLWNRDDRPFDPKAPQFYYRAETTTDDRGGFVLEHVPPIAIGIGRTCVWKMPGNRSASAYTQTMNAQVHPGEALHVQIGGMGRPVVGHLIVPGELAKRDDWEFGLCNVSVAAKPLPLPMPDNVKKASLEDQQKWYATFNASEAGKKFAAAQWKQALTDHRQFPMEIQRDGSFRIDDVPAGDFKLYSEIISKGGNGHKAGDTLASIDSSFTVPPIPGERSDEPLKLADAALHPYSIVRVGDVAPDFSIKTLEGKPLKLSDYRGKLVLLDFWATWCGSCVAELPNIKAANDYFAKTGQVQFISLSMDDGPFEPKAYVDEHGYNWVQGFLGSFENDPVTKQYGIESIPSLWLIGKDGKVIDKNLRGERVKEAIEKSLAK
jgi:peroxiredoxin